MSGRPTYPDNSRIIVGQGSTVPAVGAVGRNI